MLCFRGSFAQGHDLSDVSSDPYGEYTGSLGAAKDHQGSVNDPGGENNCSKPIGLCLPSPYILIIYSIKMTKNKIFNGFASLVHPVQPCRNNL